MIRSLKDLLVRKRTARLGKSALEWLRDHEGDFKISRVTTDAVPWKVKPLAELMFLLTALKRHGLQTSTLNDLISASADEGAGFDWHELAAYDPSAATGMALVADFYRTHNRPVPFDIRFFEALHEIDYFEGMDRLPYRDMDLAYNLGRLVSPEYENDIARWFRSTAFGRMQHAIRYTIDDIYSLTHAVFYLTDLGLQPPDKLLDAATVARLRSELVTLTAAMIRADNTDVLGELLLCWLFCRVPSTDLGSVVFDHALDRMIAAATRDGAVAPTAQIFRLAEDGQASFGQLYHTTLVGAFLFSLLTETETYAIN
jgi:hypothetical protein